MEASETIKGDSAQRLLLGPLYLLGEFTGAFLPGCILLALLYSKGVGPVVSGINSGGLGYRTKLALAGLAAYIIGKSISSAIEWVQDLIPGSEPEFFAKMEEVPKQIILGAAMGPLFRSRGGELEYYVAVHAGVMFELSSGLALVIASAIPGDKTRLIQVAVGLLLLASGIRRRLAQQKVLFMVLGMVAGNFVFGRSLVENIKSFKVLMAILPALRDLKTMAEASSKSPVPPEPPAATAPQPRAEVAEGPRVEGPTSG